MKETNMFKVKVRKINDKKWQDFSGIFKEEQGWNKKKIKEHMQKFFSKPTYSCYQFALFICKTNRFTNNNVFDFSFDKDIKISTDNKKVNLT